jgi:hypothetical protein
MTILCASWFAAPTSCSVILNANRRSSDAVSDQVAEHLLATLREAEASVAHASVEVDCFTQPVERAGTRLLLNFGSTRARLNRPERSVEGSLLVCVQLDRVDEG